MSSIKTGRATITLEVERLEILKKEAMKTGLNLPLYCRMLLGDIADKLKENKSSN